MTLQKMQGYRQLLDFASTALLDSVERQPDYTRPKGVRKNASKYMPHQGKQECARRVRHQKRKQDKIR